MVDWVLNAPLYVLLKLLIFLIIIFICFFIRYVAWKKILGRHRIRILGKQFIWPIYELSHY